jgi:hypothetical protein
MKAGVLFAVFLVLVAFSGCIDENKPLNPKVTFRGDPYVRRIIQDDTGLFVLDLTILKITPKYEQVPWDDVFIRIVDMDGETLQKNIQLSEWPGESGTGLRGYYVEPFEKNGTITVGDSFRLTNLDRQYLGGTVSYHWKKYDGQSMGSLEIPLNIFSLGIQDISLNPNATISQVNLTIDGLMFQDVPKGWGDMIVLLNRHANLVFDKNLGHPEAYEYPFSEGAHALFVDDGASVGNIEVNETLTIAGVTSDLCNASLYVRFEGEPYFIVSTLPPWPY